MADSATIQPAAVEAFLRQLQSDICSALESLEPTARFAHDVWQRADGATMVSLMSDDNHSLLQRNLYLEFRLLGE